MRFVPLILVLCGLFPVSAIRAAPAKSPVAVARSCRTAISHTLAQLARLGLRELERCERRRADGRTERDCAVLRSGVGKGTTYRRWEHRAAAIIQARCPLDTTARASFPGKRSGAGVVTGDPGLAIPSIGAAIEAGARATAGGQGAARIAAASPELECVAALASARTLVATATMTKALRCQRVRDHETVTTGPLAPDCQTPPDDGVIRRAAGWIAGTCGRTAGLQIGACDALPQCALDAAVEIGVELARIAAGECGNGVVDTGEECDDGNADGADDCAQCIAPVCGNGILEGNEECDDGNFTDFDGCTDCRVAVCGDGVPEGSEECDDGNDVPLDGCTGCQFDPVACSSAGVVATVTFAYEPDGFVQIAGMRLRLRYDAAALSIPGSLVGPSISQRVTNLTGLTTGLSFGVADRDLLPSEEAPDGTDDTLQTIFAVGTGFLPPGPFEQVRFDCLGSEARASQLGCAADQVVDPFLNSVGDDDTAAATRCSITLEPAPVQ
jgi:cysteine-rich repeat protein